MNLCTCDEFPLCAFPASDELGEVRHEVGNLLCRGNDLVIRVVPLHNQSNIAYLTIQQCLRNKRKAILAQTPGIETMDSNMYLYSITV